MMICHNLEMQKHPLSFYLNRFFLFLFFLFILFLYLRNITHDVYAGDIGDIASAAALFGVPHPPGYPTLTFLGFIFSRIPLPLPIISRIALVSVFAALGGTILFFRFVVDTTKNKVVAFLSTAVLAFSYYFWLYAEVPEVFALNNFFLIAMYYTGYLFYSTKKIVYLYFTCLIVGLSMTNQQAVMFAFPGLAVFILPELWKMLIKKNGKHISIRKTEIIRVYKIIRNMVIAFFIGLLPYAYVFIAASTHPQINWMKEPTLYNFIRLILRMDYAFFENPVGVIQRLVGQQIYFSTLITTFSLVLFIMCLIGVINLYRAERRLFAAILTGFLFAGPIFIFIITPEIIDADEFGIMERMYMHSYVLFLFFLPFGFVAFQKFFYRLLPRRIYGLLFLLPFVIVVGQMIYYNIQKTDLSKTTIGTNFVHDIIGPLPKKSVIFLMGDIGTLNSWYVHYVLGYRPDVQLVGSAGDNSEFEKKIISDYKASHKKTKLKDEAIIVTMLPEILKQRPIYTMYVFPLGRKDYTWVPRGLVYELVHVSKVPTKEEYFKQIGKIIKQYHIAYRDRLLPAEQNNMAPYMSKQYSQAFLVIGDYLYVKYDDKNSAYGYYATGQMIDPSNPLSFAKIGIIQAEMPGQCDNAVENIDTSIKMYKIYRPYYTFALRIYNRCKLPESRIKALKAAYKKMFLKDLEKDLHY